MIKASELTWEQVRWIEHCAVRLKRKGPLFTHMEAVQLAFDLLWAWPGLAPRDAADAFLAPDPDVSSTRSMSAVRVHDNDRLRQFGVVAHASLGRDHVGRKELARVDEALVGPRCGAYEDGHARENSRP